MHQVVINLVLLVPVCILEWSLPLYSRELLTTSEIAPRCLGHFMIILSTGVPFFELALLKNTLSVGLPIQGEVVWGDVDCHVGSSHNNNNSINLRFLV